MAHMYRTAEALGEIPGNRTFGFGDHRATALQAAVPGLLLGHEPYDPRRHSQLQVDPLAPFSDVLGVDHVRLVRPEKPLTVNIVTHHGSETEHPVLAQAKSSLSADLAQAVDAALPGMLDFAHHYVIGGNILATKANDAEVIETVNNHETSAAIAEIARSGLTFVLSNFGSLRLQEVPIKEGLIAIKVDHALNRNIPKNIGVVSLGGYVELNTNKHKAVDRFNEKLQARHLQTVTELESSGAEVASVVTLWQQGAKYDEALADQDIAVAIRRAAEKQ